MARVALAALLVAVAACGSSDDGDDEAVNGSTGAFCAAWDAALTSGDDDALRDLLRDAPSEIADAAVIVEDDSSSEEALAAGEEIFDWVEVNCSAGPDDEGLRYIAPPRDAEVAGLLLCSAGTPPAFPSDASGSVVLYGEADRADPYDGPMLGVFWDDDEEANHAGDGQARPVEVRGTTGESAPITVFQQTVLEELGTVVAWSEEGLAAGVYGRFWTDDQTDQLVALANALDLVDGRFELPGDALPAGYEQVFSGSTDSMSLLFGVGAEYEVRYQGADPEGALVHLTGWTLGAEEFEAFRFLTLGLHREDRGGRDAIVGSAWFEDQGPAVAAWREPDGRAVRVVGLGADLEQVLAVADSARDLDRAEWIGLVEAPNECPPLGP